MRHILSLPKTQRNGHPVTAERNLEWGGGKVESGRPNSSRGSERIGLGKFWKLEPWKIRFPVIWSLTLQDLLTLWSSNAIKKCICGETWGGLGPLPPPQLRAVPGINSYWAQQTTPLVYIHTELQTRWRKLQPELNREINSCKLNIPVKNFSHDAAASYFWGAFAWIFIFSVLSRK